MISTQSFSRPFNYLVNIILCHLKFQEKCLTFRWKHATSHQDGEGIDRLECLHCPSSRNRQSYTQTDHTQRQKQWEEQRGRDRQISRWWKWSPYQLSHRSSLSSLALKESLHSQQTNVLGFRQATPRFTITDSHALARSGGQHGELARHRYKTSLGARAAMAGWPAKRAGRAQRMHTFFFFFTMTQWQGPSNNISNRYGLTVSLRNWSAGDVHYVQTAQLCLQKAKVL